MNNTNWRNFFETKVRKCNILVVGDIMLDKYYYSIVNKFASDAPVPVAQVIKQQTNLGAAANISSNLSSLGCKTTLAGFAGNDDNLDDISVKLYKQKINQNGIVITPAPTTTKIRIMSRNMQLFRLDFEDTTPHSEKEFEKLKSFIKQRLNDSLDAIILADYEMGVCDEKFCSFVITTAHNHGVPIIVMPCGQQWLKYKGADCIVSNTTAMNKILIEPIHLENTTEIERASFYIMNKFSIENILIIRSNLGISLITEEYVSNLTLQAQENFDDLGVSDAVISAFSMALAGGLKPADGAYIANVVAGIVLRKTGNYVVTQKDILKELTENI